MTIVLLDSMKTTDDETFAQDLRERREKAGLSQLELATRAGVHQTSVAHWEAGRGTRTLLRVLRFAAALKLRPSDFV
jgi:transcriptional regulator with XRE-family HTH domain